MKHPSSPRAGFRQAAAWAFAMSWGQQGIRAALNLVLAALLGPTVFGTMALALALIQLLQLFLEQGLSAAIIQRRDLDDGHLDSAFWLVLGSSLLLFAVCIALRGEWAAMNRLPELATILPFLGLILPIHGLTVVQETLLQRNMAFRSLAIRSGVSTLVGGLLGVAAALAHGGVWSLVTQEVSAAIVGLALLWGISHWRPGLRFSRRHLGELMRFSSANLVGRIGLTVEGVAETALMGMFFGPTTLGIYRLARRLMETLLSIATRSIQAVSLPELARLQERSDAFEQGLMRCLRASAVLSIPALLIATAFGDLVMRAVGPEWTAGGPTLEVLCILGAVQSLTLLVGPLLQAIFRPGLLSILIWVRGLCLNATVIAAGLLFAHASAETQALSIAGSRAAASLLIFIPIELAVLLRFGGLRGRSLAGVLGPSCAAGLAGALVALAELRFLPDLPARLALLVYGPPSGMVALAALLVLDRRIAEGAQQAIRRLAARLGTRPEPGSLDGGSPSLREAGAVDPGPASGRKP